MEPRNTPQVFCTSQQRWSHNLLGCTRITHNASSYRVYGKSRAYISFLFALFNCITPQTNDNNCVFMTIQKCTVVCLQITFHMLVINIERIISFEHNCSIVLFLVCVCKSHPFPHNLWHSHSFCHFHSCMALFKETFGQSKKKKKKDS